MKRILFTILLFALMPFVTLKAQSYQPPFASYTPFLPISQRNIPEIILEDGVYEVTVQYKSSTEHEATYKLNVYIRNDTVEKIYFNNGGSLHSGFNNSGYTYRGGGVVFSTDFQGNITSGEARIQVIYDNGQWQYFVIYI
jgi:hypothetical protein